MAVKVSIRTKIIAVTCALLALSVLVYSAMASVVFKRDKTALVFDLNNSAVTNISSEVDSLITSVAGKMELFALMSSRPADLENLQNLFHKDPYLVYLSLASLDGRGQELSYLNPGYSQSYGVSESYFQVDLPEEVAPPLESIEKEGQAIWNAATATHPLLMAVGRQVIQEDQRGVPVARYAVIAYVSLGKIVDLISGPGRTNDIKIVNRSGEVLVEAFYRKESLGVGGEPAHVPAFVADPVALVHRQHRCVRVQEQHRIARSALRRGQARCLR